MNVAGTHMLRRHILPARITSLVLMFVFVFSPLSLAFAEEVAPESDPAPVSQGNTSEPLDQGAVEAFNLYGEGEEGAETQSSETQDAEAIESEGLLEPQSLMSEEGDSAPTLPDHQLLPARSSLPQVEESTGALVQRVALDLPPGRNGLTPELNLAYNSQNLNDDIVGYGWSLDIPYIERLNKTGTEKIYDDDYFTSSLGGELVNISTTTPVPGVEGELGAGLVSYWKLDESSGVAYDATSTNDLTNNNSVPFAAAKLNNGASFAAPLYQKYFSISDASQSGLEFNGGDFSIALWFNLNVWNSSQFHPFVSKYDLHERSYRFGVSGEGTAGYFLNLCDTSGSTCADIPKGQTLNTGIWYHTVMAFDADTQTATFYHNGSSIGSASTTYTGAVGETSNFNLAANSYFGNYSDIKMDEVGMWNRTLSASDAMALYNNGDGLSYDSGSAVSATSTSEYRHRHEDGRFVKYTFASSTWTAYDKNGTRYLFGATNQSQQFATTATSSISKWMLEEVRDTNGNYIRYVYTRDGNQIYPSQIIYTGNGVTDGPFTIDITKSARPDVMTSYENAYKVTTAYRISEITASVDGSWVRKYSLGYGSGANGSRSLLTSIQERGRDSDGVELAQPAITFAYSSTTLGYTAASPTNPHIFNAAHMASDVDGNGLPDHTVMYLNTLQYRSIDKNEYTGFTNTSVAPSPDYWAYPNNSFGQGYDPLERGVRFFDVSGDGKADVLRSVRNSDGSYSRYYAQNTSSYDGGFSWSEMSVASGTMPVFSYATSSSVYSSGVFGNVNGDGLVDYVVALPEGSENGTYIHDATSTGQWYVAPSIFTPVATLPATTASQVAAQLVDINGDGLDDWIKSTAGNIEFCLNTGATWDASCISAWNIATSSRHTNGWDRGIRFFDINGDGLTDYVRAYDMPSYSSNSAPHIEKGSFSYVYLNTGSGWATSTLQSPINIFRGRLESTNWTGRIEYNEPVDWNGDGIPDFSHYTSNTPRPDVLVRVTYPTGGTTDVEYRSTAQMPSNKNLAFPLFVVTKMTNSASGGTSEISNYSYSGGEIYLSGNIRDRRFAGFETISEQKGDTLTKTYFYQGNGASTTAGEYVDNFSKIGRSYRTDILASSTGTLLKRTFTDWQNLDLGNDRDYVYLATTTEMTFEGNATHRDKSQSFRYSSTTGDILEEVSWGEVSANSNGTFTDTGTDRASTTITYVASTTGTLVLPMQRTTYAQNSATTSATQYMYDTLTLGSVTKGNLTKQQNWISGTTYASTTKSYNSYGLVTQEFDPRSGSTTYQYDLFNLYVATTTNVLNHVTGNLYDYATGKVRQTIDPNSRRVQTIYDPLGRVKEIKQPDLNTPTTLVTKAAFFYATSTPNLVQETNYLTAATSTTVYRYYDGLGRLIQSRQTAEDGNLIVRDYKYNNRGLMASSSLPYFGGGASSTAPGGASTLYTSYTYDALDRPTVISNSVGTTQNSYDDWHTIVTDPRGKRKDFYTDAYGNLTQVIEHVASTHGTTTYSYDYNKNLTKITDALGNIRNFTYDGLNRRVSSEDLHATADTAFGSTTYAYDLSGNLTQTIDPKTQTVNYTYDALNRPLTEDYTGSAGTEITYAYDTCAEGVGRLCGATTTDAATNYRYNALGGIAREARTIDGSTYLNSFEYDRLGNVITTTYPDGSEVLNTYNVTGQLERVARRVGATTESVITDIDYGPHGMMTYEAFANSVRTTRTYDPAALYRLTNIQTYTSSSTATSSSGVAGNSTLSNGLVSYWSMDESSGVAYDSKGSNDLTNNNTVGYTTGKVNNAASFAAQLYQKYLSISDNSQSGLEFNGGDFSIALWFNLNTWNSTDFHPFVSKYDLNERNYRFGVSKEGYSHYHFDICDTTGSSCDTISQPQEFSTGTWYNAVISFDADSKTLTIYHNGTNIVSTSTAYSGAVDEASAFNIAANAYFGNYGDIKVDEVGIWNRELTQSDVNDLYNLGNGLGYGYGGEDYGEIIKDITYTYDANGNITEIVTATEGIATSTINYTYDDLNRLTYAEGFDTEISTTTNGLLTHATLPTNLISYWMMDESSGIAYDVAGPNDLSNNNTVPFVSGKINNGADFVEANQEYFSISDASQSGLDLGGGDFSFSLWFNLNTWNNGQFHPFISKYHLHERSYRFGLTKEGGSYYFANLCDSSGESCADIPVSQTFSTGVWYHTVMAFDADTQTVTFYHNGSAVGSASTTYTGAVNDASAFNIAANAHFGNYGNLKMDEVGVWNKTLTASEVTDLYNSGNGLSYYGSTSTPDWSHTYSYDILGNMTYKSDVGTTTYAGTGYANPHAPTSVNGVTYSYDNNGNLISAGSRNFNWNYRNTIASIATSTATTTYAYDHANQRVRQYVPSVGTTTYASRFFDRAINGGAATSTAYIYAGDLLVATVESNGTATSTRYMHPDHLGSTNVVTNASGTAVQVLEYYPYGSLRSEAGTDVSSREFIGQMTDEATNLSYLNARYMDSARGQFLSQDPVFMAIGNASQIRTLTGKAQIYLLSDPQKINAYSYAINNPIKYSDPSGLFVDPFSATFYAVTAFVLTQYGGAKLGTTIANDIYVHHGPYSNIFSDAEKGRARFSTLYEVGTFGLGAYSPQVGMSGYGDALDAFNATLDANDTYFGEYAYAEYNKNHKDELKGMFKTAAELKPTRVDMAYHQAGLMSPGGSSSVKSDSAHFQNQNRSTSGYNQAVAALTQLRDALSSLLKKLTR